MSKAKPNKRRYAVVRTPAPMGSKMNKKTKEKIVAVGLPFATTFLAGGVGMLANYTLGCILVAAGLTMVWFFITWMGWVPLLSRKYIQYPGYAVIFVASLILALCAPSRKLAVPEDTNEIVVVTQPVTATAQDSPGSRIVSIGEAHGPVHVDQSVDSTPEAQLSGVLMPANEADPFISRTEIPKGALKIFLGPNVMWSRKVLPFTVLKIGAEDIIWVQWTNNGLFVSANVWREDGRAVAKLINNAFTINPNNYLHIERPDRHELRIFDKVGGLILKVRYVNEWAIAFQGTFYDHNKHRVIATEEGMFLDVERIKGGYIAGSNMEAEFVGCAFHF